jgi:hypothetical protein
MNIVIFPNSKFPWGLPNNVRLHTEAGKNCYINNTDLHIKKQNVVTKGISQV